MYATAGKLILFRFHVQQTTDECSHYVGKLVQRWYASFLLLYWKHRNHAFDASGIAYYTFKAWRNVRCKNHFDSCFRSVTRACFHVGNSRVYVSRLCFFYHDCTFVSINSVHFFAFSVKKILKLQKHNDVFWIYNCL